MANFHFDVTVPLRTGAVRTAALGATSAPSDRFTSDDLNKVVKLGPDSTYVLAEEGDDIEGVVVAVESTTVNNGFSQGSVQRFFGYQDAEVVEAGTPAVGVAVGDEVVAADQNALGTKQDLPLVQPGTGTLFRWRVVSLAGGDGSGGTRVILEPINL